MAGLCPEIRGLLASIGIQKGAEFAPDERITEILTEARSSRVRLARSQADIARNEGRIAQLEIEILLLGAQRCEAAVAELRDLSVNMAELSERKLSLEIQKGRLELKAPISGLVYDLAVTTENAVIRRDEPVLHIVPRDKNLLIAARVNATEIDSIYAGQSSVLRFAAFSSRTTPELQGTVSRVSPDVLLDEQTGQRYYSVYAEINEGEMALFEGRTLVPGMPVEAYIQTESRTPIASLLQPFTEYFHRVFRES